MYTIAVQIFFFLVQFMNSQNELTHLSCKLSGNIAIFVLDYVVLHSEYLIVSSQYHYQSEQSKTWN